MNSKLIWTLIAVVLICVMLLGNKKVRIFSVFLHQIKVFKNNRTGKASPWDFVCFIVLPICLAYVVVYKLNIEIDEKLAEILTTVFSLSFTVLFGFSAIIIGKIEGINTVEKQVARETFVSIVSATLLSLIAAILSILSVKISNINYVEIISLTIFSISFITLMLLFLITKRTFAIYTQNIN